MNLPRKSTWLLSLVLFALLAFTWSLYAADTPPSSGTAAALKLSTVQWLIPVLVPAVIAALKKVFPEIPGALLPFLCPGLGWLSDYIAKLAGTEGAGPEVSAALGALGLYLRELFHQSKKTLTAYPRMECPAVLLACALGVAPASGGSLDGVPPDNSGATLHQISDRFDGKVDETADARLFRPGEISLDSGLFSRTRDFDTFTQGGVVGVNWFPWRAAGFFGEARTESFDHSIVDNIGFGITGRLPLDKLHLAPHISLGADYDFEEGDQFSIFAAGGVEFRINEHVGLVAEVRGYRPNNHQRSHSSTADEYLVGLLKLRATF